MQIVEQSISVAELQQMSNTMFGGLVKAVVDIEKGIMVVDAPMHSDQEELLLDQDSKQEHLWGINLFPDKFGTDSFIVFDSMINMRPAWENHSRGVENDHTRAVIIKIVHQLVKR
jgi:hypothetical protein